MHWMMQPKVAEEPQPFRANAGAQNQWALNNIPAPTPPSPGITYSLVPRILTVVFIQVSRTLTPGFQAPTILPKTSQYRNGISLQNLGSRRHPPARHLSPAPLGAGAPLGPGGGTLDTWGSLPCSSLKPHVIWPLLLNPPSPGDASVFLFCVWL